MTFPAGPAFPNPSMNIMIYTDQGLSDVSAVISYTLASAPAGLPGDYNDDNKVDAADYVVWRNGGPLQNETVTIGSVTPDDYNEWRANFGKTVGSGSASGQLIGSVPEPATAYLFVVAVAWLLRTRRFR